MVSKAEVHRLGQFLSAEFARLGHGPREFRGCLNGRELSFLFSGVLSPGESDILAAGHGDILVMRSRVIVYGMQSVWLKRLKDEFGIDAVRIDSEVFPEKDERTVTIHVA